jgi:hypothetical protein
VRLAGRKKILKDADGSPVMSPAVVEDTLSSPDDKPQERQNKADLEDYVPTDPTPVRKPKGRPRGGGRGRGRGTTRGRGRGRGRGRSGDALISFFLGWRCPPK